MGEKKEYIERGKLIEDLKILAKVQEPYKQSTILGVIVTISQRRAADVVEVVRCKDCIHSVPLLDRLMCKRTARKSENGWFGLRATADHHYCSYGERKEQT